MVVLAHFQTRYASRENPWKKVNDLLEGVFDRSNLATHLLTGQRETASIIGEYCSHSRAMYVEDCLC